MFPALRQGQLGGRSGFLPTRRALGFVATRPHFPNARDTTSKWIMGRSTHVATDNIQGAVLAFCNFCVTDAASAETSVGGTSSITASIEYPAGVLTQVKFRGSSAGQLSSVAGGRDYVIFGDPCPVNIPYGATFWVRHYMTSTVGIVYSNSQDTAGGDALSNGPTVSAANDKTMGGTVTNSGGTTVSAYPVAILGYTDTPNGIVIGDSIAWGQADAVPTALDDFRKGTIVRGIPATKPFLNLGIGGSKMNPGAATAPWLGYAGRRAFLPFGKYAVVQGGTNDLNLDSRTAAQLLASVKTLVAEANAPQRVLCTLIPQTTGAWTTAGGQTVTAHEADRLSYNASVRAGVAGFQSSFECADAVESARDSGFWLTSGSPPYTADGTHPNSAGNALIAAAISSQQGAILV